jgi:hypothetical protein
VRRIGLAGTGRHSKTKQLRCLPDVSNLSYCSRVMETLARGLPRNIRLRSVLQLLMRRNSWKLWSKVGKKGRGGW